MMQVLVFDPLSHIGSTLHNVLAGMPAPVDASLARDWAEVRSKAVQQPTVVVLGPNVLQADLPNAARIGEEARNSTFILVTDDLDAQSLQSAMRNGIRDVVAVHDVQVDLVSAVERARSLLGLNGAEPAPKGDANGKIVAVFGPKGGTGKTTVATNLAISSAKAGIDTAMLDANPTFGDCASFLRVRPKRTLDDIAGLGDELDDLAIAGVMIEHGSGLKLLTASNQVLNHGAVDVAMLEKVMSALRRSSDLVIVDTGPTFDAHVATVLEAADLSYLVTSLELPAVKDAKLCLSMLEQAQMHMEKVRVIINRSDSKVGFPLEEVTRAISCSIAAKLPSDIAVPRSINRGVSVEEENPRSKIAKALRNLGTEMRGELLATEAPQTSRSLTRRVMRPRLSEG
jgi:pilus assembly protein CpaE